MHTTLSRRDVVKGLVVGGVPATATLAAILANPMLSRAAAAGLDTVSITTEGGKPVKAALAARGLLPPTMRLPMVEATAQELDAIEALLAEAGVPAK